MLNSDTVKLLDECNSGIKMGVSAIDEVMPSVKDEQLKQALINNRNEHEKLGNETHALLNEYGRKTKEPNPMAKSMAMIKTNMKLTMNDDDRTVAELITDGCNMGVKSLNKYLNEYKTAEKRVKDITERLIGLESRLSVEMRPFL